LLPVLLAGLANVGVLRNGLAYDDVRLLDALRAHQITLSGTPATLPAAGAAGVDRAFRDQGVRRLTYATDLLDYRLWGERPFGFHLTNLLLHMLATALVYFAARAWTRANDAALVAAFVFAVHPLHVEAIASIANRKDVLALIFGLGALLAWLRVRPALPRWLATGGLLALGLLSKEVALVGLPVILMAADGVLGDEEGGPRAWQVGTLRLLAGALGVLIAGGLLWGSHLPLFDSGHILRATEGQLRDYPHVLANALVGVLRLVQRLLVPIGLSADYPLAPDATLVAPPVLLGLAVLVALVALPLALYRRAPRVALAIAWVIVLYLPISNVIPLIHFFFLDRYAYVPSFGYCVLVGMGAAGLGRRAGAGAPARFALGAGVMVMLALLAPGTVRRIRDWRDDLTLWSAASREGFETYRIRHKLGVALLQAGDANADAAARELSRAIALRPDVVEDHQWLAGAYYAGGHEDEAWREANTMLLADSANVVCRFIRGELLLQRGDPDGALRDFRAAAVADTTHLGAMMRVAMIELARPDPRPGELEDALVMARRAERAARTADPETHEAAIELVRRAEAATRAGPSR
jgi:tetratricopeptide (TPR) repeat protein